eukprot:c9055_g1_i1 orf=170-1594(+)
MESASSDALLGDFGVCSSGCGLADEKSRAADAQTRAAGAKKLGMAIVLCVIFIAVELAGGLIANSLAILTDAAHLLSDVAGFAISLFAIWASSWEATPRQSYGFFRLEILGALLSIQLIWLLTGIIVYEAIYRMTHASEPIDGRLMFLVATFGFFVNLIMVFLLGHGHHGHDHGHDHGHAHGHDHGHDHGHEHDQGHEHDHLGHDHINKHEETKCLLSNHSHGEDHNHDHSQEHGHPDCGRKGDHNHQGNNHSHGQDHSHDHPQDDQHSDSGHKDDHNHQENPHNCGLSEELKQTHQLERSDSFVIDIDISKAKKANAGNINIRGAWLHVIGDLIQSVGVMIGGAVIWVKPEWRVVDLICTLLFSVLVLGTTIRILRDAMEILMESTPREIDVKKLEKGLCEIPGVVAIHELHIWAITLGKTLLACHVTIFSDADADAILQRVIGYCDRVFSISHVTIQIERQRGDLLLDKAQP